MTVAVIDSGVDATHGDLNDNIVDTVVIATVGI